MRSACTGIKVEKLKERDHLGDLGVDGSIILTFILKTGLRTWAGFIWLRISSSGGLF
jgi:hypothetical protein